MSFKETIDQLDLHEQIAPQFGHLKLVWLKQSQSFDIFGFQNANGTLIKIGDDADYLRLFMQVAASIYDGHKQVLNRYIVAANVGGEKLYVKTFSEQEQQDVKYAYVALNKALKALPPEDQTVDVGFYSEISLEDVKDERFAKESKKVAKILKGENQEDWVAMCEQQLNFVKTDVYVLALQKLHSWGFQAIKAEGELQAKQSLVRPIRLMPRGAVRPKRSRRN